MITVIEKITPALAKEYLSTSVDENGNKFNRPISKTTVASYADTIKAGKWMLNGVPIVFDTNGRLIDGQHRLKAVVLADIAIETAVARGVDRNAFTTFDCGRHRSLGQLLAMQLKKNYNTVGSVVSSSECLRKHGMIWTNSSMKEQKRTNQEGYEIYMRDSSNFDEAAAFACDFHSRRLGILNKSWIGGVYYHLTTVGGYDKDYVKTFFNELCSLDNSKYSAIELLRKRLWGESKKSIKTENRIVFALLIKAWNAYVENKLVKTLAYNPATETSYPRFILKNLSK